MLDYEIIEEILNSLIYILIFSSMITVLFLEIRYCITGSITKLQKQWVLATLVLFDFSLLALFLMEEQKNKSAIAITTCLLLHGMIERFKDNKD